MGCGLCCTGRVHGERRREVSALSWWIKLSSSLTAHFPIYSSLNQCESVYEHKNVFVRCTLPQPTIAFYESASYYHTIP